MRPILCLFNQGCGTDRPEGVHKSKSQVENIIHILGPHCVHRCNLFAKYNVVHITYFSVFCQHIYHRNPTNQLQGIGCNYCLNQCVHHMILNNAESKGLCIKCVGYVDCFSSYSRIRIMILFKSNTLVLQCYGNSAVSPILCQQLHRWDVHTNFY